MPIDIDETGTDAIVTHISIISNEHIVLTAKSEEAAERLKRDIKEITSNADNQTLWDSPHRHVDGDKVIITGKCDAALLSLVTLRAISLRTYRQCTRATR